MNTKGLYNKYLVINRETGKEAEGEYFVLKPLKDSAARSALEVYAENTDDQMLAQDIMSWLFTMPRWEVVDMDESRISQLVFDEDKCAEFIFSKLIADGIAVRIEDIRTIIGLEFEYGVDAGIYTPADNGGRSPVEVRDSINISIVNGSTHLNTGGLSSEAAISLLQEAINTIKAFD